MFNAIQYFLNQWPMMWGLLCLVFFILGLLWAYGSWFVKFSTRLSDAEQENARLTSDRNAANATIEFPESTGPKVEWGRISGINPRLTKEFGTLGVNSFGQLEGLPSAEGTKLDARLNARGIGWDPNWLPTWKTELAAKETIDVPPTNGPNIWNQLPGIDPRLDAEFGELGICNVEQIDALQPAEKEKLAARLEAKGISWDWNWLPKWKTEIAATTPITLPVERGREIEWGKIDSISPSVVAEFKSLGVKNIVQLEGLSDGERAKFDNRFAAKGIDWDWGWLPKWKTDIAAVEPIAIPTAHGSKIDWGKLEGTDSRLAMEFSTLGIKNIEQLDATPTIERQKLANRLKAKGMNWDWGWLPKWKTHLAATAPIEVPAASGPVVDWASLDGVDRSLQSEFRELGIKNIQQLEELPSPAKEKLTARLHAKGHRWDWSQLSAWKNSLAANASIAIPRSVGPSTDWTKIEGVDPQLAKEFEGLGITSLDQLESLPAAERGKLEARIKAKGARWDWNWLSSWKSKVATSQPITIPKSTAPAVEWSKLEGVEPAVVNEFKELGIDNVEQLEAIPLSERRAFESRLAAKGISWDWSWLSKWKSKLTTSTAAASHLSSVQHKNEMKVGSKTGTAAKATGFRGTTAQSTAAKSNGFEATSVPTVPLIPTSRGPEVDWATDTDVGPRIASEFRTLGIKCFDQLESFSPTERAKFDSYFASKGLRWDWQWLQNRKDRGQRTKEKVATPQSDTFEIPHANGPEVVWSNVGGIDSRLAMELKSLGIRNLAQLELLRYGDRLKFERHLAAKGLTWDWNWVTKWKTSLGFFGRIWRTITGTVNP